MSAPHLPLVPSDSLLAPSAFFEQLKQRLSEGERPLTFFGRGAPEAPEVVLTAVTLSKGNVAVLRTAVARKTGFHSLSRAFPTLNIFERELYEQHGLKPHDHPWLKPVRFSGEHQGKVGEYPFYRLDGKEVHEVAVGPIHAGVIEPGHFRFMCLGELVHHLEIQLGYQHRAVEPLLLKRAPLSLATTLEVVAGDTSVAHAWAYATAVEALTGVEPSESAQRSRAIGLELERVAMHLAGLAGLATDIAFLQGAATYGRLRTTAINTSMLLCGSRFGRGWVRPGGARAAMSVELAAKVKSNLSLLKTDIAIINEHFLAARTVRHRLQNIGALTREQAAELGLVGMAARMAGLPVDTRSELPGPVYSRHPVAVVVEETGDCWARALVRIREIDASLAWLEAQVQGLERLEPEVQRLGALAPNQVAVGVCEGWRGEVVHCLETGPQGQLVHYKVQDPSLRNWFGLALCLRGNEISDFPICNKSFDLSYCGNDL